MKIKIAIESISVLFIMLFTYAAVSKLIDINLFKTQISQSPFLVSFADLVAWFIPLLELLIAAILIIPRLRLIGLYMAFGVMVSFTGYITAILNFSTYVPCSCGGVLSSMGWTEHLVFNIAFVLLALVAIWLTFRQGVYTNSY
jgi:hypothetical protein